MKQSDVDEAAVRRALRGDHKRNPSRAWKTPLNTPNTYEMSKGASGGLPSGVKLLIAAAGIYGAYLNYGVYQDKVMKYSTSCTAQQLKTGCKVEKFEKVWFLNMLEALGSALLASLGFLFLKSNPLGALPHPLIAFSSLTQTTAKFGMVSSLVYKVPYAVVTLAKSAKMAPVMVGELLRGKSYSLQQYAQVGAIILGTVLVSYKPPSKGAKASAGMSASDMMGVAMIVLSLAGDGLTGYAQGLCKNKMKVSQLSENPHESMFFTNLYMAIICAGMAFYYGQLDSGFKFCQANPKVLADIATFCVCSAIGQLFIFFTIANFDSLTSTTITTTRKIFTVLIAIYMDYANSPMSPMAWSGLAVAIVGISFEIIEKAGGHGHKDKKA